MDERTENPDVKEPSEMESEELDVKDDAETIEKSKEDAIQAKEEGNKLVFVSFYDIMINLISWCLSLSVLHSLFREKDYTMAALSYTRAIELCPQDDENAELLVGFGPLLCCVALNHC